VACVTIVTRLKCCYQWRTTPAGITFDPPPVPSTFARWG